jgi:hypothetical protein
LREKRESSETWLGISSGTAGSKRVFLVGVFKKFGKTIFAWLESFLKEILKEKRKDIKSLRKKSPERG